MTNSSIRHEENFAYNKLFPNNLVISKSHKGNDMNKENFSFLKTEQNGMTITFVFPPTTGKEDRANEQSLFTQQKNEIKNILTTILPQYLTKGGISP